MDVEKNSLIRAVKISIVVPLYCEEKNIGELYRRLKKVLGQQTKAYEIIFVDDGSIDSTYKKASGICAQDKAVKVIKLSRNFGQAAALAAGFNNSKGEIVVSLDGDLQHAPEDIPKLLKKMNEGYDIVSGWRKDRKDNCFTRRFPSWVANRMIRAISGVKIKDFGITLKAYRRSVLDGIDLFGELHRFIPALAAWQGISIAEVGVSHVERVNGKSNYGLSRIFKVLLDLIVVKFLVFYAASPLYVMGTIGLLFCGVGFFVACIVTIKYYFLGLLINQNLGNLIFSVLMLLFGFQLILAGLLMEISARIYHHVGKKNPYIIKETIN